MTLKIGHVHHLKLTTIPNQPGLELHPTLELVPAKTQAEAFLSQKVLLIEFTKEDIDHAVTSKDLVTRGCVPGNPKKSGQKGSWPI